MAKTLTDVETKIRETLDDASEHTKKGRGWKFWLLVPVALTAIGAGAFFGVRRLFGGAEK